MRAAIINSQGSPVAPNIRAVTDWPEPDAPAPGTVLIRTEASALNQMDLWVGKGVPGLDLTYPRISGCDACGTIEAVGDGVDKTWQGQRVIVNAAIAQLEQTRPSDPPGSTLAPEYQLIGEHHHGMHCEHFVVPVNNVVAIGDANAVQAAAFGLTFLTAWSMIFTKGHLRPGQSVLITGIGGGVATASLAIAKWMGCPVAVTSRHQWKLDRATELGADFAILDEGQDWSRDLRTWTSKRGVDMAVDSIGAPTHLNCIKSLARGGAFVTPGNTGGPKVQSDQARIFWNQLRLLGSTMGTTNELAEVTALFRAGLVKPVIDNVFSWPDAPKAWARLEDQGQFGKIVLQWC